MPLFCALGTIFAAAPLLPMTYGLPPTEARLLRLFGLTPKPPRPLRSECCLFTDEEQRFLESHGKEQPMN